MVKEARVSWEMGRNWDDAERKESFAQDEDELNEEDLHLSGKRRREKSSRKNPVSRTANQSGTGGEWKRDREAGRTTRQERSGMSGRHP